MDTKALVTLCQKGNGQALSLLYENYSEKMLKVCLRYIPDPTIAQDLLHDGFVIIFTSIHSLRNPEKLEYWMKKIMRNLALQYLNHANANPTIPLTDIPEEEEPAENPFCPDFISYDKMLDIVESLPEGYCKVFKLAVLEGLSHKEIGDLLGIAPHSSSSQLFRAKILLKKMLAGYRVFIVLTVLLLFPTLYDYLYREKKSIRENRLSKVSSRQAGSTQQTKKTDTPRTDEQCYTKENLNKRERIIPPVPVSTEWPLAIPTMKDSIHKYPIPSPFTGQTITNRQMAFVFSPSLMPPTRKKKSGKWKLMLAGSLGPQLAQNLYKLIATPHTDGISSDFPQQVSTWEEYYSYLHTRYQQGTLGKDSIGLMQIAQNNSGRIVENQQHHAPIVVGLSLSKKLNERWSLETGLQYTLLRSEFTTGEAFRIQDNQKLHYIGIPLRLSYRFWHYKRFSGYATAGMQVDIPIKGTLQRLPRHRQYSTQARQSSGKCSLAVVGQHKYRHTISPHTPGRHLSGADCKLLHPRRQPTAHHPKGTSVHIHPPGRPPHFLVKKRCATQSFTRLIIYLYG